ncbi:hypothetical protein ACSRUE_21520 [Sorangium sp. KYC3313]|uniref:hypothetical protein n=1 Tax=Sorangium sp. KYC3313 TaxID=3449740 RepID=UPI003F8A75C4
MSSNTDLVFLEGAFAKLEGALIGVEANACDSWAVSTPLTKRELRKLIKATCRSLLIFTLEEADSESSSDSDGEPAGDDNDEGTTKQKHQKMFGS